MNHGGYDWNDAAIQRLRDLWADGHSTAEIGRRMGVSKNAIVGKAHRLDLPKRPDPVRKLSSEGPRRNVPPARLRVNTLPPLPAPVAYIPPPKPRIEAPEPVQPDPAPVLALFDAGGAVSPVAASVIPRRDRCLYPIGDRLPLGGFRVCTAVRAINGRTGAVMVYCHEHSTACYTTYQRAA